MSTRLAVLPTPAADPVYLSPEQVCELVPGVTIEILANRRAKNLAPRFYKPSQKTVVYERGEVLAWVAGTASVPRTG